MAGIAHISIGLAAKRLAPKAPVWLLVISSELIDLLWGCFALAGLETFGESPWSHGLFMAALWSVTAALLTARIYRSHRTGFVVGLVVFSHWVIDFITHPMFGGPPDLPLLLAGSAKVGLGLYSAIPILLTTIIEIGCVGAGLIIYLKTRKITPVVSVR